MAERRGQHQTFTGLGLLPGSVDTVPLSSRAADVANYVARR
jgi:hypothetical protein